MRTKKSSTPHFTCDMCQKDKVIVSYYLWSEIYDVSDQRIELFAGKNFMLECHLFMEEVVEM